MRGQDKIFSLLAGKPVLARTLAAFQNCALIEGIVVVVARHNIENAKNMVMEYGLSKVMEICRGGQERWQSVAAGLEQIKDCRWVLIHDGARPLVTETLIARGLEAAAHTGAAVPAVPVTDTVKAIDAGGFVDETLPRENLLATQTPQVFRSDIIIQAYRSIGTGENPTDDSSLVERMGVPVRMIPGDSDNIKLTTPEDLERGEFLCRRFSSRAVG